MAIAISKLLILPSPSDTDILPVVQGGVTYKATRGQIVSALDIKLQGQIDSNDVDISNLQRQKLDLTGTSPMTGSLTLSGAPSADLHATTRLFVNQGLALNLDLSGSRAMTGSLDMGSNSINNVTDPVAAQDVATRNHVTVTTAKILEAYDPTGTSEFPVTYDTEAITPGDRFRISASGTMATATVTVQIGDIIEALVNAPTNSSADWSVTNANVVTASATVAGIIEISTDAEALSLEATDRAITPANLGALNASDTQEGLVELSTNAEMILGTATDRSITPANLASQVTDYEHFIGISDILSQSTGTWTTTRIAQGDYVSRKTANAETVIIGIDITEVYRTTAALGFELNSFDVISRNITADLVSYSATLDRMSYTDSAVVTTTNVAITGTLPVGQDADPRVTNITIDSPAFLADGKYVIELTIESAGTSVYDFIGILLKFHRTAI